ncbi:MAG: hypothetical protein P8Z80_13320 [Pseudolabrys sp.]
MAKRREMLRSGDWLTRERIRLVALAVLVASVLGAGFLIATANGLSDRFDRPLGTDFSDVYAAGTYVLDGEATAPFNPRRQITRERAIFGQKTRSTAGTIRPISSAPPPCSPPCPTRWPWRCGRA